MLVRSELQLFNSNGSAHLDIHISYDKNQALISSCSAYSLPDTVQEYQSYCCIERRPTFFTLIVELLTMNEHLLVGTGL